MIEPGRIALFTFTGRSTLSLGGAIVEATRHADDWLATHQWKASDGQSAYVPFSAAYTIDVDEGSSVFYYVIHLIGPCEPTP
jgi:hypothetical protein